MIYLIIIFKFWSQILIRRKITWLVDYLFFYLSMLFFFVLLVVKGNENFVDGDQKLIMGFVWQLILHFSKYDRKQSSKSPQRQAQKKKEDPKQTLLNGINQTLTGQKTPIQITNVNTDWNDGRAIGALVNTFALGR